jgi:hypothetical protein
MRPGSAAHRRTLRNAAAARPKCDRSAWTRRVAELVRQDPKALGASSRAMAADEIVIVAVLGAVAVGGVALIVALSIWIWPWITALFRRYRRFDDE